MTALRRYLAVLATLGLAAFELALAWQARTVEAVFLPAGFGLALVGVALGLMGRRHWARLIALGSALGGATQMAVFALAAGSVHSLWWPYWAFGGLCATVLVTLAGRPMAEAFAERLTPSSLWRQGGVGPQVLAGVVVACAAAVPMLLIYAHLASVVHAWPQASLAVVGAVGLSVAAVLVLAERTAGLLLLMPFAAAASVAAFDAGGSLFFLGMGGLDALAASLAPALALGASVPMVGVLVFAKPMARYWRRH